VQEERLRRVERALAGLSDDQREVVTLHVFAGHTHEESAGLLGLTAAAVRKRYSRALERLRTLVRRDRT
jgi:RNA polymerase sigma-70 factor (ECF subfamily)